jgi:hypothetical protein
MMAVGAQQAK